MASKLNLPPGAELLGNGPQSTVFWWRGQTYRFAQGRRGGTILRAHGFNGCFGLVARAFWQRRRRRHARMWRERDKF